MPETRDRWTILDVEEEAIELVRNYARTYNKTTGDALSRIIIEAFSDEDEDTTE